MKQDSVDRYQQEQAHAYADDTGTGTNDDRLCVKYARDVLLRSAYGAKYTDLLGTFEHGDVGDNSYHDGRYDQRYSDEGDEHIADRIRNGFERFDHHSRDICIADDQIFITNVAGDINFGETASPTVWYNKMAYSSEQAAFTYDAPASALANNASYSTAHSFYAYPNPTVDDAEGGSWSARHTRLVIKVTLGTDVYYYPITLPALEANKSYEIDELILTRPGSDNPDKPVSFQDCTFQVNVVGWTTVPVSDENEDDITI